MKEIMKEIVLIGAIAVGALAVVSISVAASRPVVKPKPPEKSVCLATYPELKPPVAPVAPQKPAPVPPKPASEPVAANEPSCVIGDCTDLAVGAAAGWAAGSLIDSVTSSKKSSRSSYRSRRR